MYYINILVATNGRTHGTFDKPITSSHVAFPIILSLWYFGPNHVNRKQYARSGSLFSARSWKNRKNKINYILFKMYYNTLFINKIYIRAIIYCKQQHTNIIKKINFINLSIYRTQFILCKQFFIIKNLIFNFFL